MYEGPGEGEEGGALIDYVCIVCRLLLKCLRAKFSVRGLRHISHNKVISFQHPRVW